MTQVDVEGSKLDVGATFCYLGDMLCSGGGCDSAIAARCCMSWGKFRKLLFVFTFRHLLLRHLCPKVRGKVYTACVRSAMLHGEMWGPNTSDLERLCPNEHAMNDLLDLLHQRPKLNTIRNLASKILWESFTAGGWDGMDMYSVSRPVSNLIQTYRFLTPEGKAGLERHGLNVSRLISVNVVWLALTRKTEMLREPVFGIAGAANTIGRDMDSTLI